MGSTLNPAFGVVHIDFFFHSPVHIELAKVNWSTDNDPPSLKEIRAIVDKLNELIAALKH